jgi:predicted anti-sigma-YlaC factor YlaD
MSSTPAEPPVCASPIADEMLLDYWLATLDEAAEAAVEEHLLACDACGGRLRTAIALAEALRQVARSGSLRVIVSDGFVQQARAEGRTVREYTPPRGGVVACTISADDDLLIARLAAELDGVSRVDLGVYDGEGRERGRMADVPVDAAAGAVLYHESTSFAKAAPDDVMVLRLIAVEPAGERVLGEYEMRHTRTIPGPAGW